MGLFDKLYANCEGYYDLRAILPGEKTVQRFIRLRDNQSLTAFVKEFRGKRYNLFFGVATRDGKGGEKRNIVNIPAIWCDLDFKRQDQSVCDKKLREFPLHPTVMVESGNGYHVYWVLKEPSENEEIGKVEATLRAVSLHLGGDMSSTDASRILRIPLTENQKYAPPRRVKVVYENGSRYNLSDFEDFLSISDAEQSTTSTLSGVDNSALDRIMGCAFMQHCKTNAASLAEPQWYAMISQLCRERGGPELIHQLSRDWNKGKKGRYNENDTNRKIIHAVNDAGPYTCDKMREKKIWECSRDCGVRSPAALAFRTNDDDIPSFDAIDVIDASVASGSICRQNDASVTQEESGKKPHLADQVRDWLTSAGGVFSYQDVARDLQLLNLKPTSVSTKAVSNLRRILQRLTDDGVLERTGTRTGTYRVRDVELSRLKWREAKSHEHPIVLPLGLNQLVKIHPKSIIVVAGDRNSAKTAFLLNVALLNLIHTECHYFNSDMGPSDFCERVENFGDDPSNLWDRLNVWERSRDFHDVIFPDAVNIIDFLELEGDFYQVTAKIARIWERLNNGVAVIGLQKKMGAEHGRGGDFSAEKARLYVTFSIDETPEGFSNIGKILKAKHPRNKGEDPNGYTLRFKVIHGARLMSIGEWGRPVPEKRHVRY